jgi:xylulokinase
VTGIDPAEIRGFAAAGQMLALVPLDDSGRATRPAISWLDHRAEAEARRMTRRLGGERVLRRIAGASPTGKDLVAKVAWIRAHEPEVHKATLAYCDATSYLAARATGHVAMDPAAAGGTGLYNARTRSWSPLLARLVGFPLDRMPPVIASTDVAGTLSAEAARDLSLSEGLPVAMGTTDILAAAVGSGAVDVGAAHVYMGTSAWIGVTLERPVNVAHAGIFSVPSAANSGSLLIAESETAGACRDWFESNFGPLDDDLVAAAPAGSDGLLFLPWLFGERAPLPDSAIRGGWVGMSLEHGRPHLARSVLEGVALNLRWSLDAITDHTPIRPGLRAIGGGATSDTWLQILADVTGHSIERVASPRFAGAVGAALLAAVAVGDLPDVAAIGRLVEVERHFAPDPSHTSMYMATSRAFREIAPALSQVSRTLAAIGKDH